MYVSYGRSPPEYASKYHLLSYTHRTRYVLDNFATVAEAIEGLKKVNAIRDAICKDVPITDGQGHVLGAHIALEDATGDSAVIEHVGGEWQFYHSKTDALVMTNEPPYNEQKEILATYEPWGGNITLPDNLPGSVGKVWLHHTTLDHIKWMNTHFLHTQFLDLRLCRSYDPSRVVSSVHTRACELCRGYCQRSLPHLKHQRPLWCTCESSNHVILTCTSFTKQYSLLLYHPFVSQYGDGIYPTWWASFIDT